MECIYLDSVDSTNRYARNLLAEGKCKEGITVISADEQYAGRGQKGNSWESEPGKNLTFSIVCHPYFLQASDQFILSQAIALAIVKTLRDLQEEHTANGAEPKPFCVKWPNDIYYGDNKISGTLIECDLNGKSISSCIIGTGINVNQEVFLSDAPNPISLRQIYGHDFCISPILKAVYDQFSKYYSQIESGKSQRIREQYLSILYRKEGFHLYSDIYGQFEAEFADIEETGHLILRTRNGEIRRYEFKEVKFI